MISSASKGRIARAVAASLALGGIGLGMVGCADTGPTRVRNSEDRLVTLGLDITDIEESAANLSQDLLNSGDLGADGSPSLLLIDNSAFINNTSENIPSSRVLKKLRVALNKAGVAEVMLEASRAAGQREINDFLNDEVTIPDFSIELTLDEDRGATSNARERTYLLQLTLADYNRGVAVWEAEETITKQQKKRGLGW